MIVNRELRTRLADVEDRLQTWEKRCDDFITRFEDLDRRFHALENRLGISPPAQDVFHYEGFDIPIRLMLLTGGGPDTFDVISKEHMTAVKTLIGMRPEYSVVEIGCGIGRDAIPIAKLLSKEGKYFGIDIDRPTIEWCTQNISAQFPNCTFAYLDVKNDRYNPEGTLLMSDVQLPVESQTVDLIIAQSVFTHLLRADVIHYMKEFTRLLKPTGLGLTTFFIINDAILESARARNLTQWNLTFEHGIESGCRINNPLQLNEAVAYTPEALEEMLNEAGLRLERHLLNGKWSGYFPDALFGQDLAILAPAY
jgi:ubiquinone/menaquinone biosynthesis C-methylase UbiE